MLDGDGDFDPMVPFTSAGDRCDGNGNATTIRD
jgi:hypothetical protein